MFGGKKGAGSGALETALLAGQSQLRTSLPNFKFSDVCGSLKSALVEVLPTQKCGGCHK